MSSNYSIFPQDTALGPSQGHHKNFRQHNCLSLEQQDAHKKCSEGSRRARQTRPGHIPDERRQSSRATSVGMGGASHTDAGSAAALPALIWYMPWTRLPSPAATLRTFFMCV